MHIGILHVSDLHFSKDYGDYSNVARAIGESVAPHLRIADEVFIVITGDVAYSGKKLEYDLASQFFAVLRESVETGANQETRIVVVPGNHDVDASDDDSIRSVLVKSLVTGTGDIKPNVIRECLTAQNAFRDFVNAIGGIAISDASLIGETTIATVGQIPIVATTINSAWAAASKQKASTLVFPLDQERLAISDHACYRLGFTHEPTHWFRQMDHHKFRDFFASRFTAIFSGHEHVNVTEMRVRDEDVGCLFFESASLMESSTSKSGAFKVVSMDFASKIAKVTSMSVEFSSCDVQTSPSEEWTIPEPKGSRPETELSVAYLSSRREAESQFIHPVVNNVTSSSLFVEPELRTIGADAIAETHSVTAALDLRESGDLLLLGDEASGKTTVCHRIQDYLVASGYFATYLKYRRPSDYSKATLDGMFEAAVHQQFANGSDGWQCPVARRVLILDDLETIDLGSPALAALLDRARKHFSFVVATADSAFVAGGALVERDQETFRTFRTYEILKFWNRKRHELIRKWVELDTTLSASEMDRRIDFHEARINALIGKNLVPSTPWLVSVCLQNGERPELADLQASGMAQYYQFLITSALGQARVRKTEIDEYLNFLTQLAGRLDRLRVRAIDTATFDLICAEYSRDYHKINSHRRLDELIDAGILLSSDQIQFRHPYLYYYFLGRYVARVASVATKTMLVREWATSLYKRNSVNSLLFLAYHETDLSLILDATVSALAECLGVECPIELAADVEIINKLGSPPGKVTIQPPAVRDEQQRHRQRLDDQQITTERHEASADEIAETNTTLRQILALFSSIDVLGQIAKNYYGSLHRDIKQQIILEVTEASLRATSFLVNTYRNHSETLRAWISTASSPEGATAKSEAEIDAQVFDFYAYVVRSFMVRTARALSAEELSDDIASVTKSKNTAAYRLFLSATQLVRPITLDISSIETLANDANKNPLVFQTLRSMVLDYVRLFHTKIADRQRICSAVDVSIAALETVHFDHRAKKLLPRPS